MIALNCFLVFALHFRENGQVVEKRSYLEMLRPQTLLKNLQAALIQLLRLLVFALLRIEIGQIAEERSNI